MRLSLQSRDRRLAIRRARRARDAYLAHIRRPGLIRYLRNLKRRAGHRPDLTLLFTRGVEAGLDRKTAARVVGIALDPWQSTPPNLAAYLTFIRQMGAVT